MHAACALHLLLCLALAAAQSHDAPPPLTEWTRVLLTDAAKDDGAVCIDGTPAAVYVKPGIGENAKRFILFWEGGCVGKHLRTLLFAAYSRPLPPCRSLQGLVRVP